jgi:hypothetical protein
MKHLIVALGLALALAACSGATTSTPETSTPPAASIPSDSVTDETSRIPPTQEHPTELKVGATITVTTTDADNAIQRADITTNSVRDLGATIQDPSGYRELDEHATKGRFLIATITYVATEGTFDYNEFDWSIRMPDGQTYDPGVIVDVSRYGQDLSSGTLRKGQRAKGIVTFDIPKTHGALVYSNGFGTNDAEWKF